MTASEEAEALACSPAVLWSDRLYLTRGHCEVVLDLGGQDDTTLSLVACHGSRWGAHRLKVRTTCGLS